MSLALCRKCRVRQPDVDGKCQLCRTPFVWRAFKILIGGGFLGWPWFGFRRRRLCPGSKCGNVELRELGDVFPDYCLECASTVTRKDGVE